MTSLSRESFLLVYRYSLYCNNVDLILVLESKNEDDNDDDIEYNDAEHENVVRMAKKVIDFNLSVLILTGEYCVG